MIAELVLFAHAALSWQAPTPAAEVPAALRPHQGTWQLAAIHQLDGKREAVPKGYAFYFELTITGDRVETLETGVPIGNCTLDPAGTAISRDDDVKVACALQGGLLTVREIQGKKGLPYFTTFGKIAGLEFRLEKPDDADVKKLNQELAKFAGHWNIVYSGKAADAPKEGTETITKETQQIGFRERKAFFLSDGKVDEGSTRALWINPVGAPGQISIGTQGTAIEGTYEIKGDTLTIKHSTVALQPENEVPLIIRLRRVPQAPRP